MIDLIEPGDALLIVPPFASTSMPSLAAHVLQAVAREAGLHVRVLYASLDLALEIGEMDYEALCRSAIQYMIGERLFARAAYGLPPLGRDGLAVEKLVPRPYGLQAHAVTVSRDDLLRWEGLVTGWVDRVAETISRWGFRVVGTTSTFEQTAAGIALLKRVKSGAPDTITIIGGPNCEGDLARGIASLTGNVDHVFSGESEQSFVRFLLDVQRGALPQDRIVVGTIPAAFDSAPLPDYSEFFIQRERSAQGRAAWSIPTWVPYESSRGCWWGQKHQCTFCGLNGTAVPYRHRSAARVLEDLKAIVARVPTRKVCMTDNNMPRDFVRSLFPALQSEIPGIELFYEIKPNLSLADIVALRKGGATMVQPGIESLSTPCLRLMKKGVTASQNIYFLRCARSADLGVGWNILCAIPNDRADAYEKMLHLLPYLRHLSPPLGVSQLSIERFSAYFTRPEQYDVSNIRPIAVYGAIVPEHTRPDEIAYHFQADYPSGSAEHPELMEALEHQVANWRGSWMDAAEPPALAIVDLGDGVYLLLDTRGLEGTKEMRLVSREQAAACVTGRASDPDVLEWARENKLVVEVESALVPLVTASPSLWMELESAVAKIGVEQRG